MIKFTLRCADGHRFESWFRSAHACDGLLDAGLVTCAVCGGGAVGKAPMAPHVTRGRRNPDARQDTSAVADPATKAAAPGPLREAPGAAEQALAELRRRIEAQSEYVGHDFVHKAREMQDGLTPERPIHGEARADEARQLLADGVPVIPLPFRIGPKRN